jgi:hypothetical protein
MGRIAAYVRRHHLGIVALVVALGGTSYAAVNSIPDSGGVFHGCVNPRTGALRVVSKESSCRKARTVKRGTKRVRIPGERAVRWNQAGPQGAPGTNGQDGRTGQPGPFTAQLPSGKTVKGAVYLTSALTSYTFPFSLPSAPSVHVRGFGASPNTDCPGTVTDPQAAPGQLCVYQANNSAVTPCIFATDDFNSTCTSATRFGFGGSVAGSSQFSGQWAATAP